VTCYYIHLGQSRFSQAFGLVPQIMAGTSIAAVSSVGVAWFDPGMTVLGVCLLNEGRRLADVAHALDQFHRHELAMSTGLPKGVPSIVAFGNPCARLQPSAAVIDSPALRDRDGALSFRRSAVVPGLGTVQRICLDGAESSNTAWSLEGVPSDTWVHGIRCEVDARKWLYLWLGEQVESGSEALHLSPLVHAAVELATMKAFVAAIDFWPVFLDYSLEVREGRQADTAWLKALLNLLPRFKRRITSLAMSLAPTHAAVTVGDSERRRQTLTQVISSILEFGRILLETCIDIVAFDGLSEIGVYGPLVTARSSLTSGACGCRQCNLQTQEWLPFGGNQFGVYCHYCACGSAGMDSCAYMIEWGTSPVIAVCNNSLRLSLRITAPDDLYLVSVASAVLVKPAHDGRVSGPVSESVLGPGAHGELVCEVGIPDDTPPGLYETSIVAIVNGALVQRSYIIDIRGAE
jgi:hypothetical protein